jgi:uncharacterized membrane protein
MDIAVLSSLFGLISALAVIVWRASTLVEKLRMSQDNLERTLTRLEGEIVSVRIIPQLIMRLDNLEQETHELKVELKNLWREARENT